MDLRVNLIRVPSNVSGSTVSKKGHASQEEIEPYPLYNWARDRHVPDTKTKRILSQDPGTTNSYRINRPGCTRHPNFTGWNPLSVGWTRDVARGVWWWGVSPTPTFFTCRHFGKFHRGPSHGKKIKILWRRKCARRGIFWNVEVRIEGRFVPFNPYFVCNTDIGSLCDDFYRKSYDFTIKNR